LQGKSILDLQNKFTIVELLAHIAVKQVECSFFHTMALTAEGQVYVWGGTLGGKRGQGHDVRGAAEKYEPRLVEYFSNKGMTIQ
jgi:alpha-tubulin suppressor-like RCC1 family protein